MVSRQNLFTTCTTCTCTRKMLLLATQYLLRGHFWKRNWVLFWLDFFFTIHSPIKSPDLNPLDYFFGGFVCDRVYADGGFEHVGTFATKIIGVQRNSQLLNIVCTERMSSVLVAGKSSDQFSTCPASASMIFHEFHASL